MNRLEFEISAYIKQKFEKDDVDIIYSVDKESLVTLQEKISKADIICFQSILGENSQKSLNDISLLLLKMKWFKEIRILHGGQHLTDDLNFKVDGVVKTFIKDLMSFGMVVKEIFYEAYEDIRHDKDSFKKIDYFFDDVEIKIYKEIEETFFIPQRIPYIKTFRKSCYEQQPFFVAKEDLSKIPDILINYYEGMIKEKKILLGELPKEKSFKKEFGNNWGDFLDEIEAMFEWRIECSRDDNTEDAYERLIFNENSLKIINKLRKL